MHEGRELEIHDIWSAVSNSVGDLTAESQSPPPRGTVNEL